MRGREEDWLPQGKWLLATSCSRRLLLWSLTVKIKRLVLFPNFLNNLGIRSPIQVSSDVFKVEFEAVGEATKSKVLELFDPVRDDLKLELFENISEVEAGIRKSQEESPDNQELGELARKMGELGAGIVRWISQWENIASVILREAETDEEEYITAQRIFAANSMQVKE